MRCVVRMDRLGDSCAPMTLRLPAITLCMLGLLATACVDSKAPPASPVHTKIGSGGGALVVGNGELSLTVPAGALQEDVVVSLVTASPDVLPSWIAAGTAYTFSPSSTGFTVPAQFVIPFDPRLVSPIVDPSEMRIAWRDAGGVVQQITPTFVDTATAWFDSSALGTYWVTAPDVISPLSLFPLNNADEYHFDSDMVLTVERTSAEPNLGGADIRKVTFTRADGASGLYLDVASGPMALLGVFVAEEWQEIHLAPVTLLQDRDAIGTIRPITSSYDGHVPFGQSGTAYNGIATTTTTIEGHERVTTPAGVFETVRVSVVTDFANTLPALGRRTIEFWFAPSIGPVAIRFDDAPLERVVSGTVRGRPVAGA